MVYFMENPIKHGMIWGPGGTIIFGNTHILHIGYRKENIYPPEV